ncbi:MAG: low molecular weight protein-tyrosine-phosphatase [Propionivibrio sp.]
MKILMVCMGNICRSPLAEGVVRHLADRAGVGAAIEVDSAGTLAYHAGEQPDPRARKVAASRGYDLSRMRARRVAEDDFAHFDLVLAMDRQNLAALERLCPEEHLHKLRLFMDYAESGEADEIPDPYYGGPDGFERVLDMCEAAARGLIGAIAGSGKRR